MSRNFVLRRYFLFDSANLCIIFLINNKLP